MIRFKASYLLVGARCFYMFLPFFTRELANTWINMEVSAQSLSCINLLGLSWMNIFFQRGWTGVWTPKQPRLIVRLRLEAILGVIDKALSRCTCRAQRFVDPWHFGNTRTYTCSSQCSNPTVTKQLTLARAQIQTALDCLTTSAVLNHLLQRKSLQFGLC